MQPWIAASKHEPANARFIDNNKCTWTLSNGVLTNGVYIFRGAYVLQTEDDALLRFTCTRGLANGWVEIPIAEGYGFPHVAVEIWCANEDNSSPACLWHLRFELAD